jgi:ABC-type transport system involved in multi-copper enzyme maturation permease subunit
MTVWFLVIMLVVRSSGADVAAQSTSFGSSFSKGLGLGDLLGPDAVLQQLVGVSFNHPLVLALIGSVTVALGARACQGELLAGTLDVTLARSISRSRYLLAYVAVMAGAVALLMTVAWAAMIGFDRLLDVPGRLDPGRAALLCLNGTVVFLGFGVLALLVSVLLGRKGSATFTSVGILAVMFAISFVERIWSGALMDVIGPLSLFHWLDPGATLAGQPVPVSRFLVPLAVVIAGVGAALWQFERRDL